MSEPTLHERLRKLKEVCATAQQHPQVLTDLPWGNVVLHDVKLLIFESRLAANKVLDEIDDHDHHPCEWCRSPSGPSAEQEAFLRRCIRKRLLYRGPT